MVKLGSPEIKHAAPIVIDLTLNNQSVIKQPQGKQIRPAATPPRQTAHPKSPPQTLEQPLVAPQTPQQPRQQAITTTPSPHVTVAVETSHRTTADTNEPIISAKPVSAPHEDSKIVRETPQQHYLKEHFAYIRDLIGKRLSYPAVARRMGWSGRVVVVFTVSEDGKALSVRIKESSGYQILDTCAMDTVRNTAPFPRPPVAAEIVVPVHFRLH